MRAALHQVQRFGRDRQGTIAIIFAFTAFLVVLSVGLAIDGARAYSASQRVTAALDAAALAAAKMLDDETFSDNDIRERAERFFSAHVNGAIMPGLSLPAPITRINRSTNEVEIEVEVSLATTFGQLAGINTFNFPRSSKVVYEIKRIEMSMVLDITGSMCMPCDKIDALKAAADDVVQTMLSGDQPYGYVRIGIVPYASAVNAGPFAGPATMGASTDNCTVERSGVQAYTDAPVSAVAPLGASDNASNPQYGCPVIPIIPLTSEKNELQNAIRDLTAGGATAGHIGLGWGWYMVSQSWAGFWPVAARPRPSGPGVVKSVLLMTDGQFNTSYVPGAGLNSTDPTVVDSAGYQAKMMCDNMRTQGIIVYAVAFQAPPEAEALLRYCTTSAAHFYAAANAGDLRSAFRQIADRLLSLRVKS